MTDKELQKILVKMYYILAQNILCNASNYNAELEKEVRELADMLKSAFGGGRLDDK